MFRHLGDRLRRRRLELGLGALAMAARLGVCVTAYYRWEKGLTQPRLEFRPAVDRELGLGAETSTPQPLPARFKAWRLARGLSQEAAGRVVGLNEKTLWTFERGARVNDQTLAKVRAAPAVPPDGADGLPPGVRLRAWRITRGLSERAIAMRLGIEGSTVCRLERGRHSEVRTRELVERLIKADFD